MSSFDLIIWDEDLAKLDELTLRFKLVRLLGLLIWQMIKSLVSECRCIRSFINEFGGLVFSDFLL